MAKTAMRVVKRALRRPLDHLLSYWWPPVQLRWQKDGDIWRLMPSLVNVRETAPGFWNVFLGDAPSVQLNHNSAQGAKAAAWTYAQRTARAMYGTKRIELAEEA